MLGNRKRTGAEKTTASKGRSNGTAKSMPSSQQERKKASTLSKLNLKLQQTSVNVNETDGEEGSDQEYYPGMYTERAMGIVNKERSAAGDDQQLSDDEGQDQPAWLAPLFNKATLRAKSEKGKASSPQHNARLRQSGSLSPSALSDMASAATHMLRSSNSQGYALDVPRDMQRYARSPSVTSQRSDSSHVSSVGSGSFVRKIPRKTNQKRLVPPAATTTTKRRPGALSDPNLSVRKPPREPTSPGTSRTSLELIDKISSALSSGNNRLSGKEAEELLAFLPELRSLNSHGNFPKEKPPFMVDVTHIKQTAVTQEKTKTGLTNHLALQKKLAVEEDEREAYDRRLISAVRKAAMEKKRQREAEEAKRLKRQGKFAHVKSRYMQASKPDHRVNSPPHSIRSASAMKQSASLSSLSSNYSASSRNGLARQNTMLQHRRSQGQNKKPAPTSTLCPPRQQNHSKIPRRRAPQPAITHSPPSVAPTPPSEAAADDLEAELVDLLQELVVTNQIQRDHENTSLDPTFLTNTLLTNDAASPAQSNIPTMHDIVDELYQALRAKEEEH